MKIVKFVEAIETAVDPLSDQDLEPQILVRDPNNYCGAFAVIGVTLHNGNLYLELGPAERIS